MTAPSGPLTLPKPGPKVVIPHVYDIVFPKEGAGELTWYEFPRSPKQGSRLTMRFQAPPWHTTGVQPFAWDYLEPAGDRTYPVLRVAASREVRITQAIAGRGQRERPVPAGWTPPGAGLVRNGPPIVLVYRPQADGLIPDPEEPVEPHRVIGEPYVEGPERSRNRSLDELRTLHVRPHETGVVIGHAQGGFEVHVRLTDVGPPAAFAFDFDPEELALGSVIRVVHTAGVEVYVRAHEAFEDLVVVRTCRKDKVAGVPPQGSALSEDRFRFRTHEIDDVVPSRRTLALITLLETAISLIPYVGVLYDLGQLAYAGATGKNFWGYTVSKEELALMGFTVAIPMGTGAASTVRSFRTAARATKLERALESQTLAEIRRVADTGFVEAVGTLRPKQVDDLARALERHLADPRAMPLTALVGKLNQAVGDAYLATLERRLLSKVFTEDFTGFRHPQLNAAYNKYRSSPRYRRNPGLAADPATWAKRQAAATTGAPRLLLRQALGDDFVEVINRALKNKTVPRPVTKADIDNYDTLVARGVEDYGTLRNEAAKLAGFGELFEIDHLLEQRFWRNNPNLASAFDEKGLGMAFVVPKNAAVARSMFLRFGGQRIRYVHTLKTRMLRQLIPNESEAFFSVQQIWDAHAHVLRSLGADPSLYSRRLAKDFRLMAKELGQPFMPRIPSPTLFLYENGWPNPIRNPDGSWAVVRPA